MALIAKEQSNFKIIGAGTFTARCVRVIDFGTQPSDRYEDSHKVSFAFEFPTELIEIEVNGQRREMPMMLSRDFTLSLSKKSNLRAMLETWRGRPFTEEELKGFDIKKVLGAPAIVTVIHEDKPDGKKARISSIVAPMKGAPTPERVHELLYYEVEEGESPVFRSLPDWMQKRIRQSHEWRDLFGASDSTAPAQQAQPQTTATPQAGAAQSTGTPATTPATTSGPAEPEMLDKYKDDDLPF